MGANISGMSGKFLPGNGSFASSGVGGRAKESDEPSRRVLTNSAPNTRPLPKNEEKVTSSSAHQGYAAFSSNSTMRWNVDEKYRKTYSQRSQFDARKTVANDPTTAKARYERPSIEEIIFGGISESASNTRQAVKIQDPNLRDLVKRVKNDNFAVPIAVHTLLATATLRDMQQTLMVYQKLDNLFNDSAVPENLSRLHLYNSVKQMLGGPEHKMFWLSNQNYDYKYFGKEENIPKQFWNDIAKPNAQNLSDAALTCESLSLKLNPFFVEQTAKLIGKCSDERSEAFDKINEAIWHGSYPGKKEDVLKNPQEFIGESYNAMSLALGCVGTHISILKRQMAQRPKLQTNENQQQIQMADAVYEKTCDVMNRVYSSLKKKIMHDKMWGKLSFGSTNSWQEENIPKQFLDAIVNPGTHTKTVAGHADSFADLGQTQIAKLTSSIEVQAYRDFGDVLRGAIPEHQSLQEFHKEAHDQAQLSALERLAHRKSDKELIVLEKLGSNIHLHAKRELDIKLGKSTVSRGELIDQGHKNPCLKEVRLTIADTIRGSRSMIGNNRGYCMAGYKLHGKTQGYGRNEIGLKTNFYLKKALDLPAEQRKKNIERILTDLRTIKEKVENAPVTFVASSVFIAIDENNPENTKARLIDLAHPVREDDSRSHADYNKLNHQFNEGISHLISECEELLQNKNLTVIRQSHPFWRNAGMEAVMTRMQSWEVSDEF